MDFNFCKDHRDKIAVQDSRRSNRPWISYKLNSKRKLAKLITQYGNLLSNCTSWSTNNAQNEHKYHTPFSFASSVTHSP